MPAAFPVRWQFERRIDTARKRLAVALVISLVLHAIGYGTYRVSPTVAAAVNRAVGRVLPKRFPEERQESQRAESEPKREVPMVFVEVDPALATPDPPKETKNYSTHNTLAANPEPKKAEVPKIDGTQTRVLRTTDNPKPEPKPLQPNPSPEKAPEPEPVQANPKPKPDVGDLAMAKVEAKPLQPSTGDGQKSSEKPPEKRSRPRTLEEAKARLSGGIAGRKMSQDGGVPRPGRVSLDAEASAFGDYDGNLIRAVQAVWWNAVDERNYDKRGMVRVAFVLHADGRVSNVEIVETTLDPIGTYLCHHAIEKPKNYGPWPKPMLQQIGKLTREVTFTFYYE